MGITRRKFIKDTGILAGLSYFSGILNFDEIMAKEMKGEIPYLPKEDVLIPSTDVQCVNFCGIRVRRVNGIIRAIYGNPESPHNKGHLCPKGVLGFLDTYSPYRLKKPLKRTNPKKGIGEDPKWVEISYEEAFEEITKRLLSIKDSPEKLIWQHAHGKYLIDDKFPKAFCKAFGTPNVVHRTTVCEAARHVADELTWGYHGFLPDLDNCRYFINMGSNPMEAEQWARWLDRKIIENIERGMKYVVIEPRLSNTATKAHKWVPIKPGTDVIFLLAMAKELINNNYIDEEFLINYTNAPYLVDRDGKFLRDGNGKILVFDKKTESANPFEEGVLPALFGSYKINEKEYKTSFQTFKESIQEITPEYASSICGISKKDIIEISREFGENAFIGTTTRKEGKNLRYRPVSIHTFRGLSHNEYSVQTNRARQIVMMLVGSFDAVGGMHLHNVYKEPKYMEPSKCEFPPKRVDLQESVYFPHSTHNIAQQVGLTLKNPEEFHLKYKPEIMICYATNRIFSTSNIKNQIEGYKNIFTVVIDIQRTEISDFADILLPDKTYLESWHWSPTRWNLEAKHIAIRQPIVNVYNLQYDAFDYLMEIASRVGILDKYIEEINKAFKINLGKGRKYTSEEVVAEIAKANGTDLNYLKENGLKVKKFTIEDIYLKGVEEKFKGPNKPKMALYAENLVLTKEKVKETVEKNNIKNIDTSNIDIIFSPIPLKEHSLYLKEEKGSFDFYLITYKRMYFNQTGNILNPYLREIAPDSDENFVLMNKKEAIARNLKDGEYVFVESKIGKIKIKLKTTEGIRPDTVAISYHFGQWATGLPNYVKKGANPNWIIELKPDRISGMNSFNGTKVKIYSV